MSFVLPRTPTSKIGCIHKGAKRGFTLTEIAIVLGIMGLILGAIWVAAAGVYNNQRINQGQTAVLQVLQGVRTLYSQQATMAIGDQSSNLISAGVIPTNLVSGATLISPWGGNLYVGTKDGLSIVIGLNNMTSSLCVGMVAAIFGASHDRTLQSTSTVQGSGANVVNPPTVTLGTTFTGTVPPIANGTGPSGTPGAAGTYCQPSVATNGMELVFGLQG